MKKLFFLTVMVTALFLQHLNVSAQVAQLSKQVLTETFNGSLPPSDWTANPIGSWGSDPDLFVPDNNSGNTQSSILGTVPTQTNSSTILETRTYNFTNLGHVFLRFNHICKISPRDTVIIQYKITNQTWKYAGDSGFLRLPPRPFTLHR